MKNKEYEETIKNSLNIINEPNLNLFPSLKIRAYINLIQSYLKLKKIEPAMVEFNKCMSIIEFNYGSFHVLHIELYIYFAEFYFEEELYDDSLLLLKSAMFCTVRILGEKDKKLKEIYLLISNVYMKKGMKKEENVFLLRLYDLLIKTQDLNIAEIAFRIGENYIFLS